MRVSLPPAVCKIIETMTNAGFTCEIVGGAVRDLILDVPTNDWDFATNATPEQVLPLFSESFYENAFGTVMIAHKHLTEQFSLEPDPANHEPYLIYDITTYRSDGEYRNHRKPESVTWGKSIEEDLKRRDFTINSLALRVHSPLSTLNSQLVDCDLIDPYKGQNDLEEKIIRTVGDPTERFAEDALRMLRAVRFSCQLGFAIEEHTGAAIITSAPLLKDISAERIGEETMKMIASPRAEDGIRLLDRLHLLPFIIPELLDMKGVKQSGHHIYDVWEHSMRALGTCPSTDPIVRLATLLHDVGKPATARETPGGTMTFYGHEVVGARMAKSIARNLRLGKFECDRVFTLVRWHMFTYERTVTDAYIRRFINRVGIENLDDMIDLRTADRLGSGSKATSWRLEELQDRIYAELHQPLKITDLVINGHDVMTELKIAPGPIIGKLLTELFEDVLDTPEHNTKEYLIAKLHQLHSV